MYALRCPVQTYDWGKKGNDSLVARIASQHDTTFKLNEDQSYAELWMGTHKNGPAEICVNGRDQYMLLHKWLAENKSAAGDLPKSIENCGTLPFLLKILSVDTALSIQAHPDMELAINLHEAFPDIYKDPNHKPEMAVALTEFEALCGFRDLQEILKFFSTVPEFKELVGEKVMKDMEADPSPFTLRNFFCAFVNAEEKKIKIVADRLNKRLKAINENNRTDTENLVLRLCEQHPGDIGVFCPYLLNYIKLQPGQAVFLSANEPHAYIAGDCVECMACSDNVVRAGLTTKFIDKLTLCDMLSYTYGRPDILEGKSLDPSVQLYIPPVDEFCIEKIHIRLKSTLGQTKLRPSSSGSILIVTEGKGMAIIRYKMDEDNNNEKKPEIIPVNAGSTFFICADADVRLQNTSENSDDFVCYRARINTEKNNHLHDMNNHK